MRSDTTFVTALLASSVAVAQPRHHGHHRRHQHQAEKRELKIEWETVWETATVYVDESTTETVLPEKTPAPQPETNAAPPSPPPAHHQPRATTSFNGTTRRRKAVGKRLGGVHGTHPGS